MYYTVSIYKLFTYRQNSVNISEIFYCNKTLSSNPENKLLHLNSTIALYSTYKFSDFLMIPTYKKCCLFGTRH